MTRMHAPKLAALVTGGHDAADNVAVTSPVVGIWQPRVGLGQLVRPGDEIGALEVLGVVHRVIAPEGAFGAVVEIGGSPATYGARLYLLDPAASIGGVEAARASKRMKAVGGLTFTAPTSGRFYSRSGPGKPAFVKAGDLIKDGQTICLLEVMKTFNRVVYDAATGGLPAEARVLEVCVADEADVDAGAVLLRLEPA